MTLALTKLMQIFYQNRMGEVDKFNLGHRIYYIRHINMILSTVPDTSNFTKNAPIGLFVACCITGDGHVVQTRTVNLSDQFILILIWVKLI